MDLGDNNNKYDTPFHVPCWLLCNQAIWLAPAPSVRGHWGQSGVIGLNGPIITWSAINAAYKMVPEMEQPME